MAILEVEISSLGEVIGHLPPDVFLLGVKAPRSCLLAEAVERFNTDKSLANEPERARVILARKRKGKSIP